MASERQRALRAVIDEVIRRRRNGERVADEELLVRHADLRPELDDELARLTVIQPGDAPAALAETRSAAASEASSSSPSRADESGGGSSAGPVQWPPAPDSIPGYTLLGEVHRGGQGAVYRAVHQATQRTVAIKIMHGGTRLAASERARFEREAQILRQLQHPHVVRVRDSGVGAGGFFLAMDFIDGAPLDEFAFEPASSAGQSVSGARVPRLAVREAIALFVKIADAVSAAHLRGVIHRDLKPGNILIDAAGEPHVLDFGLAKFTSDLVGSSDSGPALTQTGQFVGSLPWASPEQAEGRQDEIDIRTDVYALGVVLYQALTGVLPYDVRGGMSRALQSILTVEPVRPSLLRRELDDEVETIILRCLQKDPARRYQSAGELRSDLQRYLAHEPIEAKRDSGWYLLRKTIRRHKLIVGVAVGFLFAGFAFGAVMAGMYQSTRRALQERLAADAQLERAAAEQRAEAANRRLHAGRLSLASTRLAAGQTRGVQELLDACVPSLRGLEWQRLSWIVDRSSQKLAGHGHFVMQAAFDPVGGRLATVGMDGGLRLWRRDANGRFEPEAPFDTDGGGRGALLSVAWRPDGAEIAIGGEDQIIRICSPEGEVLRELRGHWSAVTGLCWIADDRLLSISQDGTVRIWSPRRGRELRQLRGPRAALFALAVSPDRTRVAVGGEERSIFVWELPEGAAAPAPVVELRSPVRGLAFSSDGTRLAVGADRDGVQVFELGDAPRKLATWPIAQPVHAVRFSGDDTRIAAGGADGVLRLLRLDDPAAEIVLHGHTGAIESIAPIAENQFVTTGRDRLARIWDGDLIEEVLDLRGHHTDVNAVTFVGDGTRLVSGGSDFSVKLWDTASGEELQTLRGHEWAVLAVAPGPDSQNAVSAGVDGTLRVWSLADGRSIRVIQAHEKACQALAVDRATQIAATGGADGAVRLWDLTAGTLRATLCESGAAVLALGFSPDGRAIAVGDQSGLVRVWTLPADGLPRSFRGHSEAVHAVAFSPDGRWLASGGADHGIQLWPLVDSSEGIALRGHEGSVRGLAWRNSPGGAQLISCGEEGVARVWDAATGEALSAVRDPAGSPLASIAVDAETGRMATSSADGRILIWDQSEPSRDERDARETTRRARRCVDRLLLETGFAELAAARLRAGEDAEAARDERVRDAALRIVLARGDNPQMQNDAAWAIVQRADGTAEERDHALRLAQAAVRGAPQIGAYLNTLGIAEYRAGRFGDALETLRRSTELNGAHPADSAFIVACLARLGRVEEARVALADLRELMRRPWFAREELWVAFLREAESAVQALEKSGAEPSVRAAGERPAATAAAVRQVK